MLPEGLNGEDIEKFKVLAKFAFHSYYNEAPDKFSFLLSNPSMTGKVTFFKEDIPDGLIHFGFMNESTELYASEGVEKTYSFLHLSLQEYLAVWHLANSNYSIEFQVEYCQLAVETYIRRSPFLVPRTYYNVSTEEERALLKSIERLRVSLVEQAVFFAGITGLRCQSECDRIQWRMFFHGIDDDGEMLLRMLYEAQNEDFIPHYFAPETKRRLDVISPDYSNRPNLPDFDYYALSYCLAHCSDELILHIHIRGNNEISRLETFVKGLKDHCILAIPSVKIMTVTLESSCKEITSKALFWLMKTRFLPSVEYLSYTSEDVNNDLPTFLQSLKNLQSLNIHLECTTSLDFLAA